MFKIHMLVKYSVTWKIISNSSWRSELSLATRIAFAKASVSDVRDSTLGFSVGKRIKALQRGSKTSQDHFSYLIFLLVGA